MIYIDMDGVLTDFVGSALRAFGIKRQDYVPDGNYSMEEVLGIETKEFWNILDSKGEELWSDMEALPWATDLIDMVESYGDWNLLTSPTMNSQCASGKLKWMQKHFGYSFRKFLIVPSNLKQLLGKKGDLLIDDSDRNCQQFSEAGGSSLLFPQPWNSNEKYIINRMTYVEYELEERYGRT